MKKFYTPTDSIDSWASFLASPDKQWRKNYSAMSLAVAWEQASGFPNEIKELFASDGSDLSDIEFLAGFPEHKVLIPGGSRASQNDIFVLAKTRSRNLAIVIEGKAEESFGQYVSEWRKDKKNQGGERLAFLLEKLGGIEIDPEIIRYQLLHRLASAVVETKRFGYSTGAMIVHSFSENRTGLKDFCEFMKCFEVSDFEEGKLYNIGGKMGIDLYVGWVVGAHSGDSDLEKVFKKSDALYKCLNNADIDGAMEVFGANPVTVYHNECEQENELREVVRSSLQGFVDGKSKALERRTLLHKRVGDYILRGGQYTDLDTVNKDKHEGDFFEVWQEDEKGEWYLITQYERPSFRRTSR